MREGKYAFLSLCFSQGTSHGLVRDTGRGLLFVFAISMRKRRGKKRRLVFDSRLDTEPRKERGDKMLYDDDDVGGVVMGTIIFCIIIFCIIEGC